MEPLLKNSLIDKTTLDVWEKEINTFMGFPYFHSETGTQNNLGKVTAFRQTKSPQVREWSRFQAVGGMYSENTTQNK